MSAIDRLATNPGFHRSPGIEPSGPESSERWAWLMEPDLDDYYTRWLDASEKDVDPDWSQRKELVGMARNNPRYRAAYWHLHSYCDEQKQRPPG